MAPSPNQLVWRRRIESGLRVAEPGLNVLLIVGDRFSRWVDRGTPESYVPARRVAAEPGPPRVAAGPPGGGRA